MLLFVAPPVAVFLPISIYPINQVAIVKAKKGQFHHIKSDFIELAPGFHLFHL